MSPEPRRGAGEGRLSWLLPLLLVPVALLCDPAAALPLRSYYFRDFTTTFYPLRVLQAHELAAGRLPAWNPYVFEGTFLAPELYPPELLHALLPGPALASWLLTLHLPLAALAAYWLARELGASRAGGFVAGAAFSLSGFALSSLNLYVFLQALALTPLVVGLLRRAALHGGRAIALAALAVALALSTYAVEFLAQAVLLGVALGLAARPGATALARAAGACVLGAGIAAVPIVLVVGVLGETPRGTGFASDVALANAVHPAVLAQALLPHLFGLPQAPAEAFWGGRFFSKGLPYFLTIYVGPLAIGLAALGLGRLERRARLVLALAFAVGVWYALGEWGGLAPALARVVPGSLRFPSKALLLPHAALALLAGFGLMRLVESRLGLRNLAAIVAGQAVLALGIAGLLRAQPAGLAEWAGVPADFWPRVVEVAARDAALVLLLAVAVAGLAWIHARGLVSAARAAACVGGLLVADLARVGAGLNPQVHASFYDTVPEIAALRLAELDGGRVFSYGLDHSPAFRELLARGGPQLTLTSFFIHRQLLGPYANVIDGIEATEGTDITSFVPRERELAPELYQPARVRELLPWLKNAGVSRVLSLDPLDDAALVPLAEVPAGPPGVAIHVYGFDSWPRASLACRATPVASRELALAFPYREGFDPWREVALEAGSGGGPDDALAATCTKGRARRAAFSPSEERYEVETNASAYLVVRASHARGWRAEVDGVPTPVQRANGKHRAVAVPAGRHEVVLRYEPPWLVAGIVVSLGSLALALALVLAGGPAPRRR